MIEDILGIETADGVMETFVCRPERGDPAPAVLMLMDAPGIREELYDMARRLAATGFAVLLPNLYYRAGRDARFDRSVLAHGSAEHARMRAIRTKMTIPPVMEDVGAMLAWIDGQDDISGKAVGAHGYCMSGPYALAAAARYPDRVAIIDAGRVVALGAPADLVAETGGARDLEDVFIALTGHQLRDQEASPRALMKGFAQRGGELTR